MDAKFLIVIYVRTVCQNYWPITAIGPVLGCSAAKLQHSCGLGYNYNYRLSFRVRGQLELYTLA